MTPDPAEKILALLAEQEPMLNAVHQLELAANERQSIVAALKAGVADQEDAVAAEALEAKGLTNETMRKAHVAKALREDPVLRELRGELSAAQGFLAEAQAHLADAERRWKGAGHSMQALGQLAFLEGARRQAEGYQAFLRAAQVQLQARQGVPRVG